MSFLKPLAVQITKASYQLPLQAVLVAPFVLLLISTVGIMGWIGAATLHQSVDDIAKQLDSEATRRINQRLESYLAIPHQVNQINADAVELGLLNINDLRGLIPYYWRQIKSFNSISLTVLVPKNGGFVAGRRSDDGKLQISIQDRLTAPHLYSYNTDDRGNLTERRQVIPNFDARKLITYQTANRVGKPTWVEVFQKAGGKTLAISAAQPIYNAQKDFVGIAACILDLDQFNDFLSQLRIGKSGQTLILERSGLIVADSSSKQPFQIRNGKAERIKGTDSSNILLKKAAQHLEQHFGSLDKITTSHQLEFFIDGKRQFLQVTPFNDSRGLDWLIVVTVPETDFTEGIEANKKVTFWLCLMAVAIAIFLGIVAAQLITRPILQLRNAAAALAQGEWQQKAPITRVLEVRSLAHSFNQMATQLQQSFTALQAAKEGLEIRVKERTAELTAANEKLQSEILERRRSEATLRSIMAGTASATGENFFRSLVRNLAAALEVNYAFISVCTSAELLTSRTIVLWKGTDFAENFEYAIANTPSEQVIKHKCYQCYPKNLQQLFPKDLDLVEFQAESYMGVPLIDSNGEILGGLAVIDQKPMTNMLRNKSILEIFAARAAAEIERQRSEEALRFSERFLDSIVEHIPLALFVKDANNDFRNVLWNQACERMFGIPREQAIGLNVQDLQPPEQAEFFLAKDREAVERGELIEIPEEPFDTPDQKTILLRTLKVPILDEHGKGTHLLCISEDITLAKQAELALRAEQEKSERLLLNILPKAIADQLKQYQGSLAERFDEVTVLFADIVGFTEIAAEISPLELVDLLNRIFSTFDRLSAKYGLEKIKTIGDAYLVVGGLPIIREDHAEAIALMALEMQAAISNFFTPAGEPFQIRIGISTGPVVAGVIGIKKFIYDLWGDTVNTASRMESQGLPGYIQVTATTYEKLQSKFVFEERGVLQVKGKGEMMTYFLKNYK